MKNIDIKSIIIGALLTSAIFLGVAATSKEDKGKWGMGSDTAEKAVESEWVTDEDAANSLAFRQILWRSYADETGFAGSANRFRARHTRGLSLREGLDFHKKGRGDFS